MTATSADTEAIFVQYPTAPRKKEIETCKYSILFNILMKFQIMTIVLKNVPSNNTMQWENANVEDQLSVFYGNNLLVKHLVLL